MTVDDHSFLENLANLVVNSLSQIILQFPMVVLELVVVFFTFYFVLRDKEILLDYIKSLLPYSKEVEKKIFEQTKSITVSVLYGQVLVGSLQGVIISISLFLFNVPNALFLSLVAIIAAIIPVIGQLIVWIPVVILLLVSGNNFSAFGVTIFGVVASTIDNLIRPMIVARKTQLHLAVILVGMTGGLFFFGILGLILGPLILAYLLIILEHYRNKKNPGILISEEPKTS